MLLFWSARPEVFSEVNLPQEPPGPKGSLPFPLSFVCNGRPNERQGSLSKAKLSLPGRKYRINKKLNGVMTPSLEVTRLTNQLTC